MRNMTLSITCLAVVLSGFWPALASAQITLEIKDYAVMPITGLVDGKGGNDVLLARVNALREEPGGANRFFVIDLNGRRADARLSIDRRRGAVSLHQN